MGRQPEGQREVRRLGLSLGRFPVALYKEQLTKLSAMADEIRTFINEHHADLKAKHDA
jgi:hypothetical protein